MPFGAPGPNSKCKTCGRPPGLSKEQRDRVIGILERLAEVSCAVEFLDDRAYMRLKGQDQIREAMDYIFGDADRNPLVEHAKRLGYKP